MATKKSIPMTKYCKKAVIFIVTLVCFNTGRSSEAALNLNSENKKEVSASFNGVIRGKDLGKDSIRVFFKRDFLSPAGTQWELNLTRSSVFYVKPDNEGKFSFTLPNLSHPGKIQIHIVKGREHPLLNEYIVEPGDNLSMEIVKENDTIVAEYSGAGAHKYLVQDVLKHRRDSIENRRRSYVKEIVSDSCSDKKIYECRMSLTDIINGNVAILDQSMDNITPVVYKLLKAEVESHENRRWISILRSVYNNKFVSDQCKNAIVKAYSAINVDVDTLSGSVLSLSSDYIEFILQKTINDIYFSTGLKPSIKAVYLRIRRMYFGALREKLLSSLLISPVRNLAGGDEEVMFCIDDARKYIKTDFVVAAFDDQSVFRRGRSAYNFSLVDSAGRAVRLSDFRGKVVLQDTWFTGCTGCAIFYRLFKDSISPEFEGDSGFVVVSVCSDRSKETWLKSIKSGIYTNPRHVNLLIPNGWDENSPFKSYYHFTSAPFILLIDRNGKIFNRIIDYTNVSEVRRLIREALET